MGQENHSRKFRLKWEREIAGLRLIWRISGGAVLTPIAARPAPGYLIVWALAVAVHPLDVGEAAHANIAPAARTCP